MEPTPFPRDELLAEARRLDRARDYPALAALLRPWDRTTLAAEPELLFLRADVGRRVGLREELHLDLDLLERTLAPLGNVPLHRRRLNLHGSVLFEEGRVSDARDAWLTQLEDAAAAEDEEFAARACNNLGVVATLRDELAEALTHYTRALAAYHRVGYPRGLGQSHHNLGITYREMGFLNEADGHFREAERFAREGESVDELARVDQERAVVLFLLGDAPLGRHTAERAGKRYGILQDPVGRGEVDRVLALISLGEGRLDRAEGELAAAWDAATRHSAALLEAEVLAARAALREHQGRADDAAADAEGALLRFAALGAEAWGRRTVDRARAIAARGSARRA